MIIVVMVVVVVVVVGRHSEPIKLRRCIRIWEDSILSNVNCAMCKDVEFLTEELRRTALLFGCAHCARSLCAQRLKEHNPAHPFSQPKHRWSCVLLPVKVTQRKENFVHRKKGCTIVNHETSLCVVHPLNLNSGVW
jgi:hypothetical protein